LRRIPVAGRGNQAIPSIAVPSQGGCLGGNLC
jgi:hypothetical protein